MSHVVLFLDSMKPEHDILFCLYLTNYSRSLHDSGGFVLPSSTMKGHCAGTKTCFKFTIRGRSLQYINDCHNIQNLSITM
jgi:hypothetical protein